MSCQTQTDIYEAEARATNSRRGHLCRAKLRELDEARKAAELANNVMRLVRVEKQMLAILESCGFNQKTRDYIPYGCAWFESFFVTFDRAE